MPVDVDQTLRSALSRLESERARLDRQIAAIRSAISGSGTNARARSGGGGGGGRRRRMSAAARRAVSVRMKKYWADRRKAKAGKGKKAEKGS